MYSTASTLPFSGSESSRAKRKSATGVAPYGLAMCALAAGIWASSFVIGFERAVTLLMLVGFGAAVIGLFQPTVGLLGIGLLCTLDAIARFFVFNAGVLPWNTFNYWLLLVMLLHAPLLLRFQPLPLQLLALFFAVAGLQLLYSQHVMLGVQHLLGAVIMFGLLVYFLRGIKSDEAWVWLALVNGVAAAVGGLIYWLNKPNLIPVNANAAAYFPLTALFSICLGFSFTRKQPWHQSALVALAVANAGWIFLSGSRGTMLIALMCLGFLFVTMRGFAQRLLLAALGVVFLAIIATRFAERKEYAMRRINKMFNQEVAAEARTSGRSDIVQVGWRIFLNHPLGVGTGNFRSYYAEYSSAGYIAFKPGLAVDAHAGWIKTLAENGLPGTLLFASFVASFAFVGWRRRRAGLFPIGLLVTVVLSMAFISTEFQGKGLWFLAAGSLLVLARRIKPASANAQRDGRIERVDTGRALL